MQMGGPVRARMLINALIGQGRHVFEFVAAIDALLR